MAVDLHLHSTYSDGSSTPEEIVTRAAGVGLSGIALTDHDTLDGISEARTAAARVGIKFIPGIELSVDWRGQSMHMLGYFLEPGRGPLQDRLVDLQHHRTTRNRAIVAKLQQLGLDITLAEVETEAGDGVIGRPHFAAVMIKKGYSATVPEAFDRYLAAGRPAYAPRRRLTAEQAIELSLASGAVPVVAHPHTLNLTANEYAASFAELVELGLGGIECYYGEYTPALRNRLAALCSDLGIVATGGSDYHGKYKPNLAIGTGRGDLRVPDTVLDELARAKK
jgi:predicted metal-dependent phosphoesterase TrpH